MTPPRTVDRPYRSRRRPNPAAVPSLTDLVDQGRPVLISPPVGAQDPSEKRAVATAPKRSIDMHEGALQDRRLSVWTSRSP